MKLVFFILSLLAFAFSAQAQTPYETSLMYKNENQIGLLMHTKGLGLSFQNDHFIIRNNYRHLDFGAYYVRHPKEFSQPNPDLAQSRSYVYGKLNSLLILHSAIGIKHLIADRQTRKSIRINVNVAGGPVAGFIKPVYYDIKLPTTDRGQIQYIQARFDPDNTIYQQNTTGQASFFKGIQETRFIPGLFGKSGINFEWGSYDNKFYSLETGIMVHAFPKEVPIFAYIDNQKVFINLYLCLTYGTRK